MPGHPVSGAGEQHAPCLDGSRQALGIAALAGARLDDARQSNSPAAMRAAMDDLQAALGEIRSRLAACATSAAATAPADPHAGHHAGGAAPPAAATAGVDHSKMGHAAPAPASAPSAATDPVCGMTVSADRHRAEFKGKVFLFCSEADRQKFVADPEKYLKAPPPK